MLFDNETLLTATTGLVPLTPEQRAAHDRYLAVVAQNEPPGHGASLREVTPEEQAAHEAFLHTLKTPRELLEEQIRAIALAYWRGFGLVDLAHVVYVEEDRRDDWVASGDIAPDDHIYEVFLHIGWPRWRNYIEVQAFVVCHPGERLEMLNARCIAITHERQWYAACGDYTMPAEVQDWFQ